MGVPFFFLIIMHVCALYELFFYDITIFIIGICAKKDLLLAVTKFFPFFFLKKKCYVIAQTVYQSVMSYFLRYNKSIFP